MISFDPTQPALLALNVSLPDLVAFSLKVTLPRDESLDVFVTPAPEAVTFTPFTACP
jgi:hypothetical protein